MALGKKCSSSKRKRAGEEGLGFVGLTRSYSFGRKRILITSNEDFDSLPVDSDFKTPLNRLCNDTINLEPEKSSLESLPQDLLIRILCGVDHDDLKQLFHVSKAIREATLIAEKCHFAYSTPTKNRAFFIENPSEFDEIEAPNAPKVSRSCKSRLNRKNLADISVALFASPKKGLFVETEM